MLYLPPGWGHDGVAVGDCLTCIDRLSRAVARRARARCFCSAWPTPHERRRSRRRRGAAIRDRGDAPADRPARIPAALQRFAAQGASIALLADPAQLRAARSAKR